MKTVNVHEAKTNLSKLLERAHRGEEIVIAKNGTPFARLVPLAAPDRRTPGLVDCVIDDAFFEPLPDDELGAWER